MFHLRHITKIDFFRYATALLVLFLALALRLHGYWQYPQRGATSDEYAYAFVGTGLLTYGQPYGWSLIRNQPWTDIILHGIKFPIVQYFFDAPPLFGLLVGEISILSGHWTLFDVHLEILRLLPIGLSIIAGILMFRIAQLLYDYNVALFALMIYSTSTIIAINQRIVVTESLLTVFMLLVLLLLVQMKRNFLEMSIVIGILSALSFLTKTPGIFVAVFSLLFMMKQKFPVRYLLLFVSIASLGIFSFIAYGTYFNSSLFWKVMITQGSRDVGPLTFWNMLANPMIVNKLYYDGWYLFGFVSLMLLGSYGKKHAYILLPAGLYLITLLLTVTQNDLHGWYVLPLFPLMAIASSVVISEMVRNPQWLSLVFYLTVGLTFIKYGYEDNFGLTATPFRILVVLMVVPVAFAILLKRQKAYRFIMTASFYLSIFISAILTWFYVHPA